MNLYLIGLRGSGKTTVAPLIAHQFGWPWVDLDQLIEQQQECSISDLVARVSWAGFRELESAALQHLSTFSNQVISVGGGAVLQADNRSTMLRTGRIVWLQAEPLTLWQRLRSDPNSATHRPALTGLDQLSEIQQLHVERLPVYAGCADFAVDTQGLSPDEVAQHVVQWWSATDNTSKTQ